MISTNWCCVTGKLALNRPKNMNSKALLDREHEFPPTVFSWFTTCSGQQAYGCAYNPALEVAAECDPSIDAGSNSTLKPPIRRRRQLNHRTEHHARSRFRFFQRRWVSLMQRDFSPPRPGIHLEARQVVNCVPTLLACTVTLSVHRDRRNSALSADEGNQAAAKGVQIDDEDVVKNSMNPKNGGQTGSSRGWRSSPRKAALRFY